jgi:hypothetical protein
MRVGLGRLYAMRGARDAIAHHHGKADAGVVLGKDMN